MKRWLQIAVVFITMLAPVAAWADLAYDGPPNDYIGFLFRNGYYRGGGVSRIWLPLGLAIAGGIVLAFVKFLLPSASKRGKVVLSCILTVVLVAATSLFVLRISREFERMAQVPLFHGWPDKTYRDTPKHRAEYDAYCLSEYKGKGPQQDFYWFHKNIPIPRRDAPEAVLKDYNRIYEETSQAVSERRQRDHGWGDMKSDVPRGGE